MVNCRDGRTRAGRNDLRALSDEFRQAAADAPYGTMKRLCGGAAVSHTMMSSYLRQRRFVTSMHWANVESIGAKLGLQPAECWAPKGNRMSADQAAPSVSAPAGGAEQTEVARVDAVVQA